MFVFRLRDFHLSMRGDMTLRSCHRLSVSGSQHQSSWCESAAQIFKFLDIAISYAVDLCPSSYDTEVAIVVIPVELISN